VRALRGKLTYANVTSTLAVLLALGMGSAYAAGELAPKSVGERQLRPGAVTADKIRKNAVTAPKIMAEAVKQGKLADGAVVAEKLGGGAVTGEKIANGAVSSDKIPNDSIGSEKVNEASLSQVPSANAADFATTAGTSNPETFAKVSSEGTVFPGDSKAIGTADVKHGTLPGIYCIAVPFAVKGGQVTPEYGGSNDVSAFLKISANSCPAPQAEVRIYNAGSLQKGPFYLVLYR
jgi:hypothetical protein